MALFLEDRAGVGTRRCRDRDPSPKTRVALPRSMLACLWMLISTLLMRSPVLPGGKELLDCLEVGLGHLLQA
jgi:hypothetical protein